MEIGTEISRKIRTAIKGKLQELGAYVDEELPDYIMVMVANKKSQDQMTDDLSLFLGNNTARFTTWLQGVLEKLRSVTPESNSLKTSEAIIFESSMPPLRREDSGKETQTARSELFHSVTHHGSQTQRPYEARLTSAVKPLCELSPSEAVIDIKLDLEDPFSEDLSYGSENPLHPRKRPVTTSGYRTQRPTAELYRPPGQNIYRPTESASLRRSSHSSAPQERPPTSQTGRAISAAKPYVVQDVSCAEDTYRAAPSRGAREGEGSRKRKLPVASSVVKVKRVAEEFQEEEEEEEDEGDPCGVSGLSSSVSVPSRPERRPTLPPSKQANKNLILKAISEAQESISRTTSYTTVPLKQTVPVAPRLLPEEDLVVTKSRAPIHHYQETLQEPAEPDVSQEAVRMDILSRLQPDPDHEEPAWRQGEEVVSTVRPMDSRSFILKTPKLHPPLQMPKLSLNPAPEPPAPSGRLIQPRDNTTTEKPASPKFIVTLNGVPSPPSYISDHETDEEPMCVTEAGEIYPERSNVPSGAEPMMTEQHSADAVTLSGAAPGKVKIHERCKYWPACKNAEHCAYHHPTAPCKAFPKCRFAEKCFFIHPNCKFDAKCTKAECPYTHASRRMPAPAVMPVSQIAPKTPNCRFFPACKKIDCLFFHPKLCRFSAQCTRADCEFYHPSTSVPPRHALTWTRAQASD